MKTELTNMRGENGLTIEGKFMIEFYLRCLNPCWNGNQREMEWDRIMKDQKRKEALEKLLK